MRALWYINLRVATEVTSRGPSGTSIRVLGHLLKAVHGICAKRGFLFASAFPEARDGEQMHPGALLRVFINSSEEGAAILDDLELNTFLSGYIHLDRVRAVPAGLNPIGFVPAFQNSIAQQ